MFKKSLLALSALAAAASANALNTGDIAFTAFNADEDGWSIVTFVDLAANTSIFFSDSTATNATTIGNGESSWQWNTGANLIQAGTVVRFSGVDIAGRAASVGSFSLVGTSNPGLSASSETVYAFLGTSGTAVTTMLTAVSSEGNAASLTTVGLIAGTNAIKLTSSTDLGSYTGSRAGELTFAAYRPLVNNAANWSITTTGDNGAFVPNTTAFTVAVVPEPSTYAMLLAGLFAVGFIARRRA